MNLTPDVAETIRIEEKPPPVALPQKVADARKFAHWGKVMYLLCALIFLLLAGWSIFIWFISLSRRIYPPFEVIFYGVGMVLSFLGAYMVQNQIIRVIDERRFHDARNNTLIWMIIGLICFLLPGIFLLLAYINLEEETHTQAPPISPSQPAQAQPQVQPPQQPNQPTPSTQPPAPP